MAPSKALNYALAVVVIGIAAIPLWYFDPLHGDIEEIEDLIGKNLDYAIKSYFHAAPNTSTTFDVSNGITEFRIGVLQRETMLKDNTISEYTWVFLNHKETVWTGKINDSEDEIIDAIRYKNRVVF